MKSKTSFFNLSLLRRDVVRFAPAWVLYGAFLLLVFSGSVLEFDRSYVAFSLADSISTFGLFNLLYAALCAQLLFGDLFSSRMCNALHALPIRREGWFATHLTAGLCFCLIPVCAAGLVFLTVLGSYWMAALLWAAALMLQFLFFFAVAAFSVMLTGNRFAMIVVYCILNFFSGIVLWLFQALYEPHLYGVMVDLTPWLVLCPVAWLFEFDWFSPVTKGGYIQLAGGWSYLGICALIALLILGAALLLYRRRALEKAGDFIAFRLLAPVFLVLYTFSAGAAFHLFSQLFIGQSSEYVFLVIGLAIGFFTGLMLLERTIRVFRGRTFARFGILMAAFGLTLLLTVLDPLGITRWVPKASEVESVAVGNYWYADNDQYAITDKEVIEQVLSIHQHAVEHPEEANNGQRDAAITIRYTLKNGTQVQRHYYVDTNTLAAITLEHVLSRPECVFGSDYTTVEALLETTQFIRIGEVMVTDREQIRGLLTALITDSLEGSLCQNYALYQDNGEDGYVEIVGKATALSGGYRVDADKAWYITYTEASINTTAWIEKNIPRNATDR